MDDVRLAVIGCGHMAKNHCLPIGGRLAETSPALRPYAERARLVAFADIAEARARAYWEQFGGDYYTTDPERVLADPKVDAVIIATTHDAHAPLSLRALAAGKHVLIEKPMVMTEAEGDAVVRAVERSQCTYMVAFRSRFAKGTQDLKREIPQPDNVIVHCRSGTIWAEGSWAQDPLKGGGQVLSQACHLADLLFYLTESEPASVYASGGIFNHSRPDVIDTVNAAVRFANGAVGAFLAGDGGNGGFDFFVEADYKGRSGRVTNHGHDVYFESHDPAWQPPFAAREYSKELPLLAVSGIADISPSFVRSIIEQVPPVATAVDGARTTRFIRTCFESVRTGRVIKLDHA